MSNKKKTDVLAVFIIAALCGLLTASADAADFDNVRIQLLNGSSIRCTIESIDNDGNVTGPKVPEGLKLEQISSLRTERAGNARTGGLQLKLIGGGFIWADSLTATDDRIKIRSNTGLDEFKLESAQGFVWNDTNRVREILASPSPDNDRVVIQMDSGERIVEGILEGIDATHVLLNYKNKSRKIALTKVNAVINADLSLNAPAGSLAEIKLIDGSMVKGVIKSLSENQLAVELAGRNSVMLSTDFIANLKIQSENLVYLSDLDPVNVEEKTLFTIQRSWQRDLSINGNPLTMAFAPGVKKTAKFAKGIGTQSYTQLVFENENEFDRFRAIVGIDAETNGRGDCVLTVQGDGVRLWSQRVRASDDPQDVSVDITGMQRIALIVEPGEQFDLGDHADWAEARFTKSK